MNERLKNAKIKDIAVTNLIYYDSVKEEFLKQFCYRNRISYLPAADRKSVYKLNHSGFTPISLSQDYCLAPDELLFDLNTVKKFEKIDENEIKFLVDKGSIIGVVHIVDYNNEFVAVEIYRSFHRFENALRSLLMKNGLSNEDLISWVKINRDAEMFNSNEGFYWSDKYKRLMPLDPIKLSKVEKQRSMVYPFQTFYFSDLLEYALDINLLDRNIFITKSLYELRNFMAHNRHFIAMAESDEGQLIYNFNHLKNFVKNINTFFSASEELERLLNNNIKTSDSILIF